MDLISLPEVKLLPETRAKQLQAEFNNYFEVIADWEIKASQIVVVSEDQKELIEEARKAKQHLVKVRTGIEQRRKQLKEESLREGQAIDGIAKTLTGLIFPIEKHLETQAEFAKRKEAERKEALQAKRKAELQDYDVDCSYFDLANMPDTQYERLLHTLQMDYQLKQEKAVELERQRKGLELLQEEFTRRLEMLSAYSKYYTPDLEYYRPLNVKTTEEEWKEILRLASKSKSDFLDKETKLREENERLKQAMAEQERLRDLERLEREKEQEVIREKERALEAERIAQENAKRLAEEQAKQKEAAAIAERKALAKASDQVKLDSMRATVKTLANQLVNAIMAYTFKSDEAKAEQKEMYETFYKFVQPVPKPVKDTSFGGLL